MEQADHGDLAALLPEAVLADVLRRVEAPRWLAVSRCVCKAWRAIIDGENLLRTDLPLSGFFITFKELCLPEFFSRPLSPFGRPAISGKLDFLPTAIKVHPDGWSLDGDYYIQDHCNGLLLLDGYVVNPATRRWKSLPSCTRSHTTAGGILRGIFSDHYYLAFDPTVSSHYQVFQIPYLRWAGGEFDPLEEASEWPPSPYILRVFSSRRGRWEERLFVREGDAAGTLAKARVFGIRLRSVYWRGSLYVHCQSDFIMRISLSEDKYNVIKPPMSVGLSNYIGLSEKGVYHASFVKNHIRICILNESCDKSEWILKHDYDLIKPMEVFDHQVHGPWILEDINYGIFRSHLPSINKEEVIQEKFEWNSDDDDFCENVDMVEVHHRRPYFEIEILGFHPYKEILFFSRSETYKLNAMAFAYHLNSFKVESLGSIYPTGHQYFDSGLPNENREIKSFPYTPCCWIEETP
ncbi:hypothetical protein CFC21_039218 [Triticum aestivum]|uniref:F-box domain-containing protein n=3 Tax=Triticum TaxID=4564 RepID=A0A9R1FFY6_WHEAT|nr:uncharacterized protein LOC123064450 [Triticum aestivum]KAF7027152.1 hypothetical protein CFC21_039218 [Triticum aestivum]CDM80592.1 unnamed protein product [Triticum aestivum]VAH71390.1 unnamed protein product [Triticum turgidum subsp. durum]